MKNLRKWLFFGVCTLTACTPQQMRKLEQSMTCQMAFMQPQYNADSGCGTPYALTAFVRSVTYGKDTKMPEGAPAPLLQLRLSSSSGGGIPTIYGNRIWMDRKGGNSTDRRALHCTTPDPKSMSSGGTFVSNCEFEDGEIRRGEYLVSELSITTDRCDQPTRYRREYETGSELLCADYEAPEGYPLILFANSGLLSPIDQRKIESVWTE